MNSIFVSSTFQDMQQERDVLQNVVLPRVKELAKQYGKNIDLCDLRWGVNSSGMSEAESTAKVLQVCFDEIDNARPFFIAILGDRYGWIPDSNVVENSIVGRNIQTCDMLDKSVTEMEIIYGALKSADSSDVRFYFREIKNKRKGVFLNPDIPKCYISGASDDKKRMISLKEKIEKQFPHQVHTYSVYWNKDLSKLEGMELFAEALYQDIEDMIVQRWGPVPALSDYEYQLYQYQYVIDSDDLFANESEPLFSTGTHPDNLILNDTTMHAQNYVLVSQDEHSLNILFSSLCTRYAASNCVVIPYECSQSVLSSSTENMVRYFVDVLEHYQKNSEEQFDGNEKHNLNQITAKFHTILNALDVSLLQRVVHLIEEMTRMPEHEIYKSTYTVAKYYHVLNMLFASIDRKDFALEMLQRAASLADDDDDKEELYAEIFSDMCAYTNDQKRRLHFSQKALAIYENLQKSGKEYSQNSYAMALHNAALIWAQQGGWKTALAHARKAYSIWSNLLLTTKDEQIKSYVTESQRLVAFLETKD